MRLVIDYRLAAYSTRGMARYCREMTKELVKILPKEWDVLLYIDKKSKKEFVPSNIKHRLLPTGNFIIGEQLFLPYFLRKDKANILWTPYNTFPLWKDAGVKYVATIHDLIFFEKLDGKRTIVQRIGGLYRKFVVSHGIKHLSACCTVSEYSKKQIEKRFSISNVVLTPNCIGNFSQLVTSIKEKASTSRGEVFFTLSGDAHSKNFNLLFQWFKCHPHYRLEAAGFPSSSYYREICPPNVTILPPNITDEQLINKYLSCKAFLFVSKSEGFGIPLLEAISCGCKIIASNSTSIPEIVADLAILINPDSSDELNAAILNIDSLRQDEVLYRQRLDKYSDWFNSARELYKTLTTLES